MMSNRKLRNKQRAYYRKGICYNQALAIHNIISDFLKENNYFDCYGDDELFEEFFNNFESLYELIYVCKRIKYKIVDSPREYSHKQIYKTYKNIYDIFENYDSFCDLQCVIKIKVPSIERLMSKIQKCK